MCVCGSSTVHAPSRSGPAAANTRMPAALAQELLCCTECRIEFDRRPHSMQPKQARGSPWADMGMHAGISRNRTTRCVVIVSECGFHNINVLCLNIHASQAYTDLNSTQLTSCTPATAAVWQRPPPPQQQPLHSCRPDCCQQLLVALATKGCVVVMQEGPKRAGALGSVLLLV